MAVAAIAFKIVAFKGQDPVIRFQEIVQVWKRNWVYGLTIYVNARFSDALQFSFSILQSLALMSPESPASPGLPPSATFTPATTSTEVPRQQPLFHANFRFCNSEIP